MYEILVCFLAGAGAGLGTGFAGLSAATVITPMLVTLLGIPAYQAIGIALASDVLASAASARTYAKSGAIDIRHGLVMMAGVLTMTLAGSWLSTFLPDATLGSFSVVMALLLGLRFLFFPVLASAHSGGPGAAKRPVWVSAAGGGAVGLVCGVFGAGGGMMMLMVLTFLLGYELKTAVGTSVFIMTFSALLGAVSHFALGSAPDPIPLALCVVFTLLWAQLAARIATRAAPLLLNRLTGAILTAVGLLLLVLNLV